MAVTGAIHHFGSFLLLAATALLVITVISAPVVNDIAILKVRLNNATDDHHTAVTFGTFGWCTIDTAADGDDFCSRSMVGYSPAQIMTAADGTEFSDYSETTTRALTKVMILHPVATGMAFISFALSVGAGTFGSLFAALFAALTFLVTLVALICDFVLFAIIKNNVNDNSAGSDADYWVGAWTILAAAICLLLGSVIVFLTCCSARRHRRRPASKVDAGYKSPPHRRRWF